MRRLLNTLYVTMPDAYLACDGENVLVRIQDEVKFRVPVHNLEGIVCFGFAGASPKLMHLCCERGVALSFLTEHGRFMGRVTGGVAGNVLLRRTQYRWADDEGESLRLSRRFVAAKIINSRAVLHRALRDHQQAIDNQSVAAALRWLAEMPKRLEKAADGDAVRGIEGEAAHLYFANFSHLLLNQKEAFRLLDRNRRPPTDRINALLSFLYTLLAHEVVAALESVGLDPQVSKMVFRSAVGTGFQLWTCSTCSANQAIASTGRNLTEFITRIQTNTVKATATIQRRLPWNMSFT